MPSLGEAIQNARKKAGLTQAELGKKLGVSGSMIGQWENNLRKPKYETLTKIANVLDMSVDISVAGNVKFYNEIDIQEQKQLILENISELESAIPRTNSSEEKEDIYARLLKLKRTYDDLELMEIYLSRVQRRSYNKTTAEANTMTAEIMIKFDSLNSAGKQKAYEYITDLSEQEKYTKPDEDPAE